MDKNIPKYVYEGKLNFLASKLKCWISNILLCLSKAKNYWIKEYVNIKKHQKNMFVERNNFFYFKGKMLNLNTLG